MKGIWLFLVLCLPACAQTLSFQPGVASPVQGAPLVTVTADFNGDGRLDLAVSNAGASSVSIFLGKGDGTFDTPAIVAIPGGCFNDSLTAGDFNNDGKVDLLAVCGFQTSVWVLPGLGNGQFGIPVPTTMPLSAAEGWAELYLNNVSVADFNGDGVLDLVLVAGNTTGDGEVFVNSLQLDLLLGKGDGTFGPPTPIVSSLSGFIAVTADFDGDGNADLALIQSSGTMLTILRGNGQGAFQNVASYPTTGSLLLGSVAVGDVNRDGYPDLIVNGASSTSTTLTVFLGNGDCTFTRSSFSATESGETGAMALADFLGTGTPDLVEERVQGGFAFPVGTSSVANLSMTIRAGNGDGTFQAPVPIILPAGLSPWWFGLAVGDWNAEVSPIWHSLRVRLPPH